MLPASRWPCRRHPDAAVFHGGGRRRRRGRSGPPTPRASSELNIRLLRIGAVLQQQLDGIQLASPPQLRSATRSGSQRRRPRRAPPAPAPHPAPEPRGFRHQRRRHLRPPPSSRDTSPASPRRAATTGSRPSRRARYRSRSRQISARWAITSRLMCITSAAIDWSAWCSPFGPRGWRSASSSSEARDGHHRRDWRFHRFAFRSTPRPKFSETS